MLLNLNADLGESFGAWTMGDDENLLEIVDSANVACGFHAGDPLVMVKTVKNARNSQTSIGAHPSYPDLQGFGRRVMSMPDEEVIAMIQYQMAALQGIAHCHDMQMTHVKPHGAINNAACEDPHLAGIIATAVARFDQRIILLAPVLSELASAGLQAGLPVALEVFADRAYTDDGNLVSRREPGAVIQNTEDCIEHILRMIEVGGIVSVTGKILPTTFHSICVHGDNAHAVNTAGQIRSRLQKNNHELYDLPTLMRKLHS